MNHRRLYLVVFLLVMALVATACAPAALAPIPTPTLASLFSEKVDVGGYKLEILCAGQGTPTVIVEAEISDPAVESGNWLSVRIGIEKTTRICVYDRAGLGSSDSAPAKSRTSQDLAKDLHTLLINANIPGPYILVGHSFGGFNVRVFASQYPKDVFGMVLVDSMPPDMWSKTLAALPPESSGEPILLTRMRISGVYPTSSDDPESVDLLASADQVRAAKPLGNIPLVVLSHSRTWRNDRGLPPEVETSIEQVWQNLQADLTNLSSNSTQVIATKAGPSIQVEEPQLVIDAILKVVDETKK